MDSSLGGLAEELGSDDDWLVGESALAQDLEEAGLRDVNNWHFVLVVGVLGPGCLADEAPLNKIISTSLSMLIEGLKSLFLLRWKNLMPFFPK